ncbi:hypothetical protein STHU_33930 [Allostella humosa]|nr:hypothetical protein STHU_33930 [Stella humosa]
MEMTAVKSAWESARTTVLRVPLLGMIGMSLWTGASADTVVQRDDGANDVFPSFHAIDLNQAGP